MPPSSASQQRQPPGRRRTSVERYRWHWTLGLALGGAVLAPAMGWTAVVPRPSFLAEAPVSAAQIDESFAALVEQLRGPPTRSR